jgi:hypothetical protein
MPTQYNCMQLGHLVSNSNCRLLHAATATLNLAETQQHPAAAVSRRRRRRARSDAASPCRCRRPLAALPPRHRSALPGLAAGPSPAADPLCANKLPHPHCRPARQAAGPASALGPAWLEAASRSRLQRPAIAPAFVPAAEAAARRGRCRRAPAGSRKQHAAGSRKRRAAGPGRHGRAACRSSRAAARLLGRQHGAVTERTAAEQQRQRNTAAQVSSTLMGVHWERLQETEASSTVAPSQSRAVKQQCHKVERLATWLIRLRLRVPQLRSPLPAGRLLRRARQRRCAAA